MSILVLLVSCLTPKLLIGAFAQWFSASGARDLFKWEDNSNEVRIVFKLNFLI